MKICSFPGCDRPHSAHGLCQTHRKQQLAGQPLVPVLARKRPLIPAPDMAGALLVVLNQGHFAIIDAADGPAVGAHTWTVKNRADRRVLYAQTLDRSLAKPRLVKLHRFLWRLWGMPDAPALDHINGNGLDCRRVNLRAATASQNAANAGRRSDNKSGVKGVSWSTRARVWVVHLALNGRSRYVGSFTDLEAAKQAYAAAATARFGEFARTA